MKKVLSILCQPPYPLHDGYSLRQYHFLKHLSDAWKVSLVAFSNEVTTLQDKDYLKSQFASLTEVTEQSPLTMYLRFQFSKRMTTIVDAKIKSQEYDLVYVAGNPLLPYVTKQSKIPIVVDLVDDGLILMNQKIRRERNLYRKIRYIKWWYLVRRFRRTFIPQFSILILTSAVDAKSISKLCPHASIHVIPNGVDTKYFKRRGFKENTTSSILCFSGNMAFEPNVDAVLFFYRKIFPIIKREHPDAQFMVIGKDPLPLLHDLANTDPSIKLTDYVDDVRPYLEKSTVYVSPMRMGSGIKNKILEAWAMSIPIVSTSTGCTGIDVLPDENIIVRDDAGQFAREVVSLLRNEQKRKRLASVGRSFVLNNYSWKSMSSKLNLLFEDALQKHK